MPGTILLVDDEEKLRKLLSRIISLEGYTVIEAGSLSQARTILERKSVSILLCDVKLPDGNGVDFTREVSTQYPAIKIILLTAYGNIPDGVKAIRNGALDYLVKGDDNDKIIPLLNQATLLYESQLAALKENALLAPQLQGFETVIGESPAIKTATQMAMKVAPMETAILITGETGTGKEVFARAIHRSSPRKTKNFVAINCSSFSRELLESELFGYKAGAFTGALKDKKGLIEMADGGTLFLDEIGEMAPELQPKLLRLLEDGSYYTLGDPKPQQANVRIIAATNRQLEGSEMSHTFRSDLFYRLAVFSIELPPLRERIQDIPALASHFMKMYAQQMNRKITGISKDAMEALQHYGWKGNIRELKNVMERAVILEEASTISLKSLPAGIQHCKAGPSTDFQLATIERNHIQKMLLATKGNKAETARLLDIGIATLYRKIEEFGLMRK